MFFTVKDQKLQICLIERSDDSKQTAFANYWALPGGLIPDDETLDECAKRELEEETGIKAGSIKQFMNFSAPKRDPRQRTISVAYIAIQSSDKLTIKAGSDAKNVSWFEISKIPKMLDFAVICTIKLSQLDPIEAGKFDSLFEIIDKNIQLISSTQLIFLLEKFQGKKILKKVYRI